ncbi:hypothetical protein R1sor_021757 [Riccia sorocarpa]|uniref:Uncharacterized protein n=1 Tax=Riccia sorocarpa TaxID=122646 RepID=A0ABD3GJE4_9MARC
MSARCASEFACLTDSDQSPTVLHQKFYALKQADTELQRERVELNSAAEKMAWKFRSKHFDLKELQDYGIPRQEGNVAIATPRCMERGQGCQMRGVQETLSFASLVPILPGRQNGRSSTGVVHDLHLHIGRYLISFDNMTRLEAAFLLKYGYSFTLLRLGRRIIFIARFVVVLNNLQ